MGPKGGSVSLGPGTDDQSALFGPYSNSVGSPGGHKESWEPPEPGVGQQSGLHAIPEVFRKGSEAWGTEKREQTQVTAQVRREGGEGWGERSQKTKFRMLKVKLLKLKTFKHVRKREENSKVYILVHRWNNSRLSTCQGCGVSVKGWDRRWLSAGACELFSEDPHQWLVMGRRMTMVHSFLTLSIW